ncbi:MAG TPA: VOC family protein [Xanthobacteraceae bacterium]|nr:VOC family protein [Xanthobacteraceae bacterium]
MASRTPMRIGAYALRVRDLDRCLAFYQRAVGLELIGRDPGNATLGNAGVPLLHLEHRPDAGPDDKTTAGLFHTAFAMPTRQDLADWYAHAQRIALTITRTGDHLVNEAIYFDDPEGNGGECYADRSPESWLWNADGSCEITTGKLVDLDALAREATGAAEWRPPAGLRIGHINVRVGDTDAAEDFYCNAVGLDHTGRRTIEVAGEPKTITFMSSGRYHHHVAANDFTSRGAGPREPERAGLSWFAIEVADVEMLDRVRARLRAAGAPIAPLSSGFETQDPWNTRVRFVAA